MLSINNLNYFIGSHILFEDASFQVNDGDKVGLVGLNGSGKTTLLKIISGEYTPDNGNIIRSNDCTIGYLNQDLLSVESDLPILEIVMDAFREIINLEHRIIQITKMLENEHDEKLIHELAELQDQYEIHEGYRIHSKAQEILEGIGFSTEDLTRPLNEYSGGWRMRVMLGKILLEKPMLLLLDEPTNHLDMPSIQWLENYLKDYKNSIVIVSHDQQFLDNIINKTVEVSSRKLIAYPGNFSFYKEEKAERMAIQHNSFVNQQKMIKDTENFIDKFRAKATKARQVQSKIKALDRLALIEDVLDETRPIDFRFSLSINPGRQLLQLKSVSKNYDQHKVFEEADAFVERGDKIALIGANGKGKSTWLRIMAGTEEFRGECKTGHNVKMTFYAQHQLEALNLENDIITELLQSGSKRTENELRTLLGCFLFTGDDIYKKIKVLSGGEKARVALAKSIISEANFLLLDEPTNHLDFFSINILKNALREYQGSYVLVSHDRQFIEEVCNKIWYIEDYKIKEYPGKLSEYLYSQEKKLSPPPAKKAQKPIRKKGSSGKAAQYHRDKEASKKLNQLKKSIQDIDNALNGLEEEKKSIEKELERVEIYSDPSRLSEKLGLLDTINKKKDALQVSWMESYQALEKLSSGKF